MKLKVLSTIALLAISMSSHASSVDWTPYLKSMQNSCDMSGLDKLMETYSDTKKLPKGLASSVVEIEESGISYFNVKLKNATAFGYPLAEIEYSMSMNGTYGTHLIFKDASFMKLVPSFYVTSDNGKKHPAGTQKLWVEVYSLNANGKSKYVRTVNRPYENTDFNACIGNQYCDYTQHDHIMKKADKWVGKLGKNQYADPIRTNKDGWDKGYNYLVFDKQAKMIQCGGMVTG